MDASAGVDSPDRVVDEPTPEQVRPLPGRSPSARPSSSTAHAGPRPGHRLVRAGAMVVATVVAVHVVVRLLEPYVPAVPIDVLRMIDVHREESLPTFVNTVLLIGLSFAVVLVLGLGRDPDDTPPGGRVGWSVVGLAALAMAADEALVLHERLLLPIGTLAASAGIETGSYRWILPGVVVAAIGVAVFVRWSVALPSGIRREFLLAMAIFATGALGVEAVSGWIDNSRGIGRLYHLVTGLEELLEMSGVLVAIHATTGMLSWSRTSSGALALRLAPRP
ncbi:hypothetical protein [Salsipaludibacter albus]|uniref:hypothetical protein n=1 Tax=Salsipaludibacter albus TaxID=2849650 RepID=UPI001EE3EBF5|nr:hypothetical protein [Salsipaludibacter albus]MBY5161230.1 hypothetical protein [Salsipaludibacter albus]